MAVERREAGSRFGTLTWIVTVAVILWWDRSNLHDAVDWIGHIAIATFLWVGLWALSSRFFGSGARKPQVPAGMMYGDGATFAPHEAFRGWMARTGEQRPSPGTWMPCPSPAGAGWQFLPVAVKSAEAGGAGPGCRRPGGLRAGHLDAARRPVVQALGLQGMSKSKVSRLSASHQKAHPFQAAVATKWRSDVRLLL
jgi:hypothetical protein